MKILVIGSGRMANALSPALMRAGHHIIGVSSRNQTTGRSLSKYIGCDFFPISKKLPDVDLILIAVNDDATKEIAKQLGKSKAILAHTSGSVALSDLIRKRKAGVFYPLETLTGKRNTSFKKIPICIEATDEKSLQQLLSVAKSISDEVYVMDSLSRLALHSAAVFTNNFTNHLLGVADEIAQTNGFPFEILHKLAVTTIRNAFAEKPRAVQTGPAKRNDQKTIRKHLAFLKNNPAAKKLYATLSESITAVHNKPVSKRRH
ncbi:MAG: hypothetical protein RL090_1060 [Bacteroidota bacterium]